MELLMNILLLLFMRTCMANINLSEYYKMPDMYSLEPYDRCMNENAETESVFCLVHAMIEANTSNPTWNIIHKYSSDGKRHYRHDKITRGLCMNWCRKKVLHLDKSTRMHYLFESNVSVIDDVDTLHNALDRAKYKEMANMCLNLELKHTHGLLAHTSIEYCISNRDSREHDALDGLFLLLIAAIISVIIFSSMYDWYLKRNNTSPPHNNKEHYQKSVPGKGTKLLVSFSLARSWQNLIAISHGKVARDLRSINALRFLIMYGVMLAHVSVLSSIVPVNNPEFLENKFHGIFTHIVINGANVLQIFFAITGFLLTIQFMDIREKAQCNWTILWKSIIYRILRYTPLYAFVVFFGSTWIVDLQDGPFWPRAAETERQFCRENWWTNLLFINNFVHSDRPCAQHTWYLAADLQLVFLGSALHILLWRFPKYSRQLLSASIISAVLVQGYVIYANKLDGVFMTSPEKQRYLFLLDAAYHISYIPFYMNTGSFLLGLIGGIIYCENRKGHINLQDNKILMVLWYSTVPACLLALLSGYIFYNYEFEKPALWISVYAVTIRNMWGLFLSILVIGISTDIGWIMRDILRLPIFRVLGRLTFAAYLIHPTVMRLSFGSLRTPIYVTHLNMIQDVSSSFVLSYIAALFLSLAIEIPISNIQKTVFNRERDTENVSQPTKPSNGKMSTEFTVELNNTKDVKSTVQ